MTGGGTPPTHPPKPGARPERGAPPTRARPCLPPWLWVAGQMRSPAALKGSPGAAPNSRDLAGPVAAGHLATAHGDGGGRGDSVFPDGVLGGRQARVDRGVAGASAGPALPDLRVRPPGARAVADRADFYLPASQLGGRVQDQRPDVGAKVQDDTASVRRAPGRLGHGRQDGVSKPLYGTPR